MMTEVGDHQSLVASLKQAAYFHLFKVCAATPVALLNSQHKIMPDFKSLTQTVCEHHDSSGAILITAAKRVSVQVCCMLTAALRQAKHTQCQCTSLLAP